MSFKFQNEQSDGGNRSWHTADGAEQNSSNAAEHNSLNLLSLTQRSFKPQPQTQTTFRTQDQNYYSGNGASSWTNWSESPQANSGGNGTWSFSSQPSWRTQWNPQTGGGSAGADTRQPVGKSNPMAHVEQGQYGDCFFEASLASLAGTQNGQAKLDSMAHQNSDGSWSVTFPGDSTKTINVSQSDLKSYKVTNQTAQLNAIEVAFLKLDGTAANKTGNNAISESAPYTLASQTLQLLTGGPVAYDRTGMFDSNTLALGSASGSDLIGDIQSALAANQPITASAKDISAKDQDKQHSIYYSSKSALIGDHEYSVVGYDSKTQQILLRNPWGDMNGTKVPNEGDQFDGVTNVGGGELLMSVDTFRKYFNELDVAGRHQSQNTAQHVLDDGKQIGSDLSQIKGDLLDNKPGAAGAAFHSALRATGDAAQQLMFLGTQPVMSGFTGTVQSDINVFTNFNSHNAIKAGTQTLGLGAGLALGVRTALRGEFGPVGAAFLTLGGAAVGSLAAHGLQDLEKNL